MEMPVSNRLDASERNKCEWYKWFICIKLIFFENWNIDGAQKFENKISDSKFVNALTPDLSMGNKSSSNMTISFHLWNFIQEIVPFYTLLGTMNISSDVWTDDDQLTLCVICRNRRQPFVFVKVLEKKWLAHLIKCIELIVWRQRDAMRYSSLCRCRKIIIKTSGKQFTHRKIKATQWYYVIYAKAFGQWKDSAFDRKLKKKLHGVPIKTASAIDQEREREVH